ncbi:MAG: hypothetical protein ACRD2R_07995 [Terriglobales bacterium]
MPISEKISWEIDGGPVGETALGPVSFMHRASAAENPAAPLGHHLQDSTHVSFGVITTGFTLGRLRAEGSIFNGREPDETRHDFDFAPLQSWSVRLSVSPTRNWSAQYSFGRLRKLDLSLENAKRHTASISYNRPLRRGNWASSLIWGRNSFERHRTHPNSFLFESTVNFMSRNYAYTRLELHSSELLRFRVGAYTFGGVRDLVHNDFGQIGLGADVTFYSKPAAIAVLYGENPVSVHVFLRFRPGLKQHHH